MHWVAPCCVVPAGQACRRLSVCAGVDSPPELEQVTPDGGGVVPQDPKLGAASVPHNPVSQRHSVGRSVIVRVWFAPSGVESRSGVDRS